MAISTRLTKTTAGVEKIENLMCPDGVRRIMFVNGTNDDGSKRGFLSVRHEGKTVSVSGYARPSGRGGMGWKFYPHLSGKNIAAIRPASFAIGDRVTVNETGMKGVISAVGWNYLEASYSVKDTADLRRKPIVVVGTANLTAAE